MRTGSTPGSRWGERKNRKRLRLQHKALAATRTASMASAARVWEQGLENAPQVGFGEEDHVPFFFFSWLFKFWQIPTFRPIKIQEGKKKKIEIDFKEKKKTTNTPILAKIKFHPKKPLWKCFWA